jgi:hypothetical protein
MTLDWPIVLGIAAFVGLVVGIGAVLLYGTRQAKAEEGPTSHPGDFVARVGKGQFDWRKPDESPEEFRARVARDRRAPKA